MAELPVRHQDAWLLVVDKPSGLATQGRDDDLFGRLRPQFPYLGLHHRLDRPASGVVLLTLDPSVNPAIARGFREHTIERTYLAVLWGEARPGSWDRPLEGRPARTEVEVLGRGAGLSAVRLSLHTGRTHQVRQHAALSGRPVVGDRRYGGVAARRWPRLALHAWRLTLQHPVLDSPLTVYSPLPDDLLALWHEAGGPPVA